jgi:hypothetical protein
MEYGKANFPKEHFMKLKMVLFEMTENLKGYGVTICNPIPF